MISTLTTAAAVTRTPMWATVRRPRSRRAQARWVLPFPANLSTNLGNQIGLDTSSETMGTGTQIWLLMITLAEVTR